MASHTVWQAVRSALSTDFPHATPLILVLDAYQAKFLQSQLPDHPVEGLYSYLSRRAQVSIASPVDIYEAFQVALAAILPEATHQPFLEGWSYAQNFAQDIREILSSLPPQEGLEALLKPLCAAWEEVAAEEALKNLFTLDAPQESLPWLDVLQLPRSYPGPLIKALYERIPTLAEKFLTYLWQKKHKVLGEELFTKNPLDEVVVLWNIFSPAPRIDQWIRYQVSQGRAQMWGWDTEVLRTCLGEPLWTASEPAALLPDLPFHRTFQPAQRRVIFFHNRYRTLTELLEEAAQTIAHAATQEALTGLWVGEAKVQPLLVHLSTEAGLPITLPGQPTLLDTRIGAALQSAYQKGTIPHPDTLKAPDNLDPADKEALLLYRLFYEKDKDRALTTFMEFLRFLGRRPIPGAEPSISQNLLVGTLAQISGLAYEKLFIVLPAREPLGPWFRPSFLPAPLRRRYYPPTYRSQTAWRLLLLLLYGAQQTHLYQLAGPENQSPLENLLQYLPKKYPCLSEVWHIAANQPPSRTTTPVGIALAPPLPLPEPKLFSQLSAPQALSPSSVSTFLRCPRQYYLAKIANLQEERLSLPAFWGTWLHEGLRFALVGSANPNPPPLSLSHLSLLQRLWKRERLYRILRRAYYQAQRGKSFQLPPLSQHPEARLYLRLWADSGALFYKHIQNYLQEKHIPLTTPLRLYPEVWTDAVAPHPEPTIRGRLDLVITDAQNTPLLALDYKTGSIPKQAGQLSKLLDPWKNALQWLRGKAAPPEKLVSAIDLQAFTYVMNFPDSFSLIVASALNDADHVLYRLTDAERASVRELWQATFDLIVNRHQAVYQALLNASGENPRQKAAELFPMTPHERLCTNCPYAVLCQRL